MSTDEVKTAEEAGVYTMAAEDYHKHPALSCSGARRLLPPSCPAIYKWEREHGRPEKPAFDFGHAAHKFVLGDGPELVVVDAPDWRTKAAKEQRDFAYTEGKVPLLAEDYGTVRLMADALLKHPMASELLNPEHGKPEQSLFVEDAQTGVTLCARLDWLPNPSEGRMLLVDYKTAVSAEPRAFMRSVANLGYYQQAAWYVDIVTALGLSDDPAFLFIVQEKTPPYLITVFELDEPALRIGRRRNRQAIDIFAECVATDTWPAYSSEVETISLPAWLEAQYEEEMSL